MIRINHLRCKWRNLMYGRSFTFTTRDQLFSMAHNHRFKRRSVRSDSTNSLTKGQLIAVVIYIYLSIHAKLRSSDVYIFIYIFFTHILVVFHCCRTFIVDQFNSGFLVIIGKSYEVHSHANPGKSKPSPSIGMQMTLRWSAW